jgi:hypothetical protein
MSIKLKPILLTGMILFALAACKNTTAEVATPTPQPPPAATEKSLPLATPYAQEPAAGICASPAGEMVTVSIYPDIPDPRCSQVRADQVLTVINQTQNTLEITLGRFTENLEPGAQISIDTPFGEYLAPGVHQLQVSPCCGAELWLEGK